MRIIFELMNDKSNNIRLLLLVLILAINSFQLAVAASSSLFEMADSQCPESQQHDMLTHHDMASHDCCEQENKFSESCAYHLCCDSGTVPSIMIMTVPLPATINPISETIEFTSSMLNSRHFTVELRPPRD
ncbi:MAG: hypothetical protein EP297_11665 [Gammaproteobacteria bacterium]|nr:MAG: hypothetical protein EP297_11665 [Gammaproteobacteria bacterium]